MNKNTIINMAIVAGCCWAAEKLDIAGMLNMDSWKEIMNPVIAGVASVLIINSMAGKREEE